MCLLLLPAWCCGCWRALHSSAYFSSFFFFCYFNTWESNWTAGLEPEGLCLTTGKAMAVLSYCVAVTFRLDVTWWGGAVSAMCPLWETCPIHPSSPKTVNCHFPRLEDTSPWIFPEITTHVFILRDTGRFCLILKCHNLGEREFLCSHYKILAHNYQTILVQLSIQKEKKKEKYH